MTKATKELVQLLGQNQEDWEHKAFPLVPQVGRSSSCQQQLVVFTLLGSNTSGELG